MQIYTPKPITYMVNENGCHICTSHRTDKDGYPFLQTNRKLCLVARYVWIQTNGDIPVGGRLKRTCGERLCINPKHLNLCFPAPTPERHPRVTLGPEARFWQHINKTDDESSCWEWTGGNTKYYGRFNVSGQFIDAHRYSYILHYGPIPDGRIICHKCNNKRCVRPNHLYAGTHKDNYNDMVRAGNAYDVRKADGGRWRPGQAPRGRQNNRSILTEQTVAEIVRRLDSGETHRAIAAHFGISKGAVTGISIGKNWAWFTGK